MSVNPVNAPQRTSTPTPTRDVNRPASHTPDAKALADEFAAAARRGLVPLPRGMKEGNAEGRPLRLGPDGKALAAPPTVTAKALSHMRGREEGPMSETRRDDSSTAGLLVTQQPVPLAAPMQAAPPVAAHVDPGVFADMLTRIWTREQGKTAREVRVSFGEAAWPATGATLLRLDDGSLRVTISVGQREMDGQGLDALRDRLNARGLNVADVVVAQDV